jgi:hypothetical protein
MASNTISDPFNLGGLLDIMNNVDGGSSQMPRQKLNETNLPYGNESNLPYNNTTSQPAIQDSSYFASALYDLYGLEKQIIPSSNDDVSYDDSSKSSKQHTSETLEVIKQENGTYDVVNTATSRTIVNGLNLNVSALCIKHLLQYDYKSDNIQRIKRFDEDYYFYKQEAEMFREKFNRTKKDVYQHRYFFYQGKIDTVIENIDRIYRTEISPIINR